MSDMSCGVTYSLHVTRWKHEHHESSRSIFQPRQRQRLSPTSTRCYNATFVYSVAWRPVIRDRLTECNLVFHGLPLHATFTLSAVFGLWQRYSCCKKQCSKRYWTDGASKYSSAESVACQWLKLHNTCRKNSLLRINTEHNAAKRWITAFKQEGQITATCILLEILYNQLCCVS